MTAAAVRRASEPCSKRSKKPAVAGEARVTQGNIVVVIEHNLEVIKTADWIIDLGPAGGDKGGEIVATGVPEYVVKEPRSYTGRYLKPLLAGAREMAAAE